MDQHASCYALIIDQTSNIRGEEQVSFILRYVEPESFVTHEVFIGSHSTPKTDAATLFKMTIDSVLAAPGKKYQIAWPRL